MDLCTYVSTECKEPSESAHQKQYPSQAHFTFSTRTNEGQSHEADTANLRPGFDPLDMVNRDRRRKEIKEGKGLPKKDSEALNDFIYVAFESSRGCQIRIRLKIIGQLKPDCMPSPSTIAGIMERQHAIRERIASKAKAQIDEAQHQYNPLAEGRGPLSDEDLV